MMNNKHIKNLAIFTTVFTLVVVALGAYTRLVDAGLGCPDWPGCYGFWHIPHQAEHIQAANQAFPDQPYDFHKAWPEMVHRYFAGTLGLLVLALTIISWRKNFALRHSTTLLILVIFQAALGMWTVTMKLDPRIVMLHLVGGFATLSLLGALVIRYHYVGQQILAPADHSKLQWLTRLVIFALIILVVQVMLGGWTSANYAALVCHEFPVCQGDWFKASHFAEGFSFWQLKAENYEYGILDVGARIAIHASHRIGAIVATLVLIGLLVYLFKFNQTLKKFAWVLSALLITQIMLGINNIVSILPLSNAVAHNAVGALMVMTMVCLLTYLLIAKHSKAATEQQQNNRAGY